MRGPAIFPGSMCGLLLVLAAPAQAGTASGTLPVILTVLPGCAVSAAPLAFTAAGGRAAEADAPIEVRCSSETGIEVWLDEGQHAVGGRRRLADEGGAAVPYAIYTDPARTRLWTGSPIMARAGPLQALRLVAYGRIEPTATAVRAGEYRDTVAITVAF